MMKRDEELRLVFLSAAKAVDSSTRKNAIFSEEITFSETRLVFELVILAVYLPVMCRETHEPQRLGGNSLKDSGNLLQSMDSTIILVSIQLDHMARETWGQHNM